MEDTVSSPMEAARKLMIRDVVAIYADITKVPLDLAWAVVRVENGPLDPMARRTELDFYRTLIYGKDRWINHPWYPWPEVIAASYGIMQIMYVTALEVKDRHGIDWDGTPWLLFEPDLNVNLGMLYLAEKLEAYGERDGVAAYNSGSPRRYEDGTLKNENYCWRVEKVLGRKLTPKDNV